MMRSTIMHARKVSHKILNITCPWMHATRRHSLEQHIHAAIDERRLSVTGLGRALNSTTKEKHCIKRADRLVGNRHLTNEGHEIYQAFAKLIISNTPRPVILIDWSDLDSTNTHFLLRASVAVDGRALSLYEEVHGQKTKEKPATHRAFIHQLKKCLPAQCLPIIVTDAGFRTPWFKMIESFGWDWVGRLRNRNMLRDSEELPWYPCKQLYAFASKTPKYLGRKEMTRNADFSCHFVLYKGKPKGRSKITCKGERARSKHSEQCAQREREPWLLVTSLPTTSTLAKKVVALYSTRMQIEEAFRDVKSVRFGIGFELNRSRIIERIQNLILIAMIATFVLWLLGMAARISEQHWQYQANTERKRHVLSVIYLGLRIANDRRFSFLLRDLIDVTAALHEAVNSHGEGW